jgi:hypothetical protein
LHRALRVIVQFDFVVVVFVVSMQNARVCFVEARVVARIARVLLPLHLLLLVVAA